MKLRPRKPECLMRPEVCALRVDSPNAACGQFKPNILKGDVLTGLERQQSFALLKCHRCA